VDEHDPTEAAPGDAKTDGEIVVTASGQPVIARPPVRRPIDIVLFAAGTAVLSVTWALAASGDVGPLEVSIFRAINELPGAIYPMVIVPMQLGALAAVPVTAVLAALAQRWWLATALGAAGLIAYSGARVAKVLVDRGRPLDELAHVVVHGPRAFGGGFPSGHSAVSAALVLAAIPYLTWRWRYALLALPLVVGFARIYVGAHLPMDVAGGFAIGVMSASLVHLALGRPTTRAEDLALEPDATLEPGEPSSDTGRVESNAPP
jgi:glycosyltransferase 2 family protein